MSSADPRPSHLPDDLRAVAEDPVLEAVVFNAQGKEIDWFDPVERHDIEETQTHWHIHVAYHYAVEKIPGYSLEIRPKNNEEAS